MGTVTMQVVGITGKFSWNRIVFLPGKHPEYIFIVSQRIGTDPIHYDVDKKQPEGHNKKNLNDLLKIEFDHLGHQGRTQDNNTCSVKTHNGREKKKNEQPELAFFPEQLIFPEIIIEENRINNHKPILGNRKMSV